MPDLPRVMAHPVVPPLRWEARLFGPSGYSAEAREFVLGLSALGVRVRPVAVRGTSDVRGLSDSIRRQLLRQMATTLPRGVGGVQHGFPPHWRHRANGFQIGRTMFETDRIPRDWVRHCNALDEIWVPGPFNVETFAQSGVRRDKLVAVPSPIRMRDFDRPRAAVEPARRDRRFRFLSVFDWSWRKGWDVLLRAFCAEFDASHDDVSLLLHVHSSYGQNGSDLRRIIDRFVTTELGGSARRRPGIRVSSRLLAIDDMPALYAEADAFVLPTRGEGWGRPFMEAMASGLPTIGTRWSGQVDFMNDGNAYLCDVERLVRVPDAAVAEAPWFQGHRWAEPSVDDLRRLMRHLVEHRAEARAKGQRARLDISQTCDVEIVCRQIIERLRALHGDTPTRPRSDSRSKRRRARRAGVLWEGSFFVHHSLANINREIAVLLARRDIDLGLIPYEPHQFDESLDPSFRLITDRLNRAPAHVDCHVRHRWPPVFTRPRKGAFILIQPWEYGSLPRAWVRAIDRTVAEVWVHTNYVRDIYRQSGVPPEKIKMIPLGVNPDVFNPRVPPARLDATRSFTFLFVGGAFMLRKGFDVLLSAYTEEFTAADDVSLVVKDFRYGDGTRRAVSAARRKRGAPDIHYSYGNWDPTTLGRLYTACDCYVHPYRSEGFGLPIIEAMACGLPVIVTDWGASRDFCDDGVAYLVPARETPLEPGALGRSLRTVDPPTWSEPDKQALRRLMRHAFENPEEARRKGRRASVRILGHFTWTRTVDAMIRRMEHWRT